MHNSTLGYLENAQGEYLMLHRVKKKVDVNKDKWIGVGGHFEDGESPDECFRREVLYEGWDGEYMYLFTAAGWTGELARDCDEGGLAWVPKEKVPELPIWEGDKIFLRLLAQDAPPFLLTLEYRNDRLVRAVLNGSAEPL